MSEEIKDIILDVKDSLNETPKKMYKYNKITFNLNELSEILKYVEQLEKENETLNSVLETLKETNNILINQKYKLEYELDTLDNKYEQLEKENIRQKEIIENLTTMAVCGDKKQIKNTAQYKLEQLENIRKEAIVYIKDKMELTKECPQDLLNILNKGGISKYE